MAKVYRRPAARGDLIAHFVYLAVHPLIGAPLATRDPALAGIRKWRVTGFDTVSILYLPHADGVSIVRVLHAARDWWDLLEIDDQPRPER